MTNPANLQELADSLAAVANGSIDGSKSLVGNRPAYQAGYRDALLDTRATVLAMIEDINRRIAHNNRVIANVIEKGGEMGTAVAQGILDGRIEAYEDVRGTVEDVRGTVEADEGWTPCECWECAEARVDSDVPLDDHEVEACDECGNLIDGDDATGHATSCSLHPDNVVQS